MKRTFWLSVIISISIFFILFPVFRQLTSFLHPIVLAVVFICMIILVYFFFLFIRKETVTLSYSLFQLLFILYTTFLLILLFFRPNDQNYDSMNLIPLMTIKFYLSGKANWLISFYNLAANIGLFIPYGVFLKIRNYSNLKLILIPLLFISSIEVTQFITHRGSLDIDDLILNFLGFLVGYLLYPLFKRIIIFH